MGLPGGADGGPGTRRQPRVELTGSSGPVVRGRCQVIYTVVTPA